MDIKRFTPGAIRAAFTAATKAGGIAAAGEDFELMTAVEAETLRSLAVEDEGWTPLTAGRRDLTPLSHAQMAKVAEYLFRKSHMARRIIRIHTDFIVGDGVQVTSQDENIQAAITEYWDDPVNNMDDETVEHVNEVLVRGEICITALVDERNGKVRHGWIDPVFFKEIRPHVVTGKPDKLMLTDHAARELGKESLTAIAWDDKAQALAGDVFFRRDNAMRGATRGVSEIYTSGDWIDAKEEIMFSQVDRSKLMNSFIWDVLLKGAKLPQIKAWLKDNKTPPKPGSIRAHNENVEWTAVSPQLGAYESSRLDKDVTNMILGGHAIPSHFFGDGGDANLATASTMSEPFRKAMKRKGNLFRGLWREMVQFALEQRVKAGTLRAKPEDLESFAVVLPDIGGPDVAKVGAAMVSMGAAIQQAEDAGYISHETAMVLFANVASQTGAEVDVSDEKDRIEKESGDDDAAGKRTAEEMESVLNKVLAKAKADSDAGAGPMQPADAAAMTGPGE